VSFTPDILRQCVGFQNSESLIPALKECSQPTVSFPDIDRDPTVDLGEVATVDKKHRNTMPVPLPNNFGDVVHGDIGYCCKTAMQGYCYTLLLVDRATRFKLVYPLRNLKEAILTSFKQAMVHFKTPPSRYIFDFDNKLIGGKVKEYLTDKGGSVEAAPSGRQNQNGLVERHWRTVVRMARSWLSSALLPSEYWWFAIKRAVEVSNYLPVRANDQLTTPFELVYGHKPDLRLLIPLFSLAYVRRLRDSNTMREKMQSTALQCILVGKSTVSDGLEFYHPPSKQVITSSDYKLDLTKPAGQVFNLKYDGGIFFNLQNNDADTLRPPGIDINTTVYVKDYNPPKPATVIAVPFDESDVYTIQFPTDGSIHQFQSSSLLDHDPTQIPENSRSSQPIWIKDKSPVTVFLPSMDKPQQGRLKQQSDSTWHFQPGRTDSHSTIPIDDMDSAITNMQVIKGYIPLSKLALYRQNHGLHTIVGRHVSAANLHSLDPPTLVKHTRLQPNDKKIWDAAYNEEYDGLQKNPTWLTLTQDEFNKIKHTVNGILPSMAISTIKYDSNGHPERAKYRIVALGNMDPTQWSKSQCYAPVLSLAETRLLVSITIRHGIPLKSGDVIQAFCQKQLPQDERYILTPPHGCPKSKPNMYWLLLRTLYGLKRSPRHWYNHAVMLLKKCGLKQCPQAPCIFQGHPIPGKPKLYLGLYVDDFIYFSTDPTVELHFQTQLSAITGVHFMGQVSHFLGIKFLWNRSPNGSLSVHMSQEAFADHLVDLAELTNSSNSTNITPYQCGKPVDSLPTNRQDTMSQRNLQTEYRSYVGSLLWISQATRPDLATITNMLAKHQNHPSKAHINAAKYAIKYLQSTKTLGITFHQDKLAAIEAFVKFPIPQTDITAFTDANWGPQDQSVPNPNAPTQYLPPYQARSISGFLLFHQGPIHWSSRRQTITARSSAESEIYATDECVKYLLYLKTSYKTYNLKTLLFHTQSSSTMTTQLVLIGPKPLLLRASGI